MFEQLRYSIGILLSRYRFRRKSDKVTSFSHAISSSKTVMVVLPLQTHEINIVSGIIQLLKRHFREENITLVASNHPVALMRMLPRSQIIHFRQQEISPFFLPRKELAQRVCSRGHDLAIDLNLDFLLPSGYICKENGAPIRVGFSRKHSELYFNFEIRPDPTLARKLIYDRLADCLQKF